MTGGRSRFEVKVGRDSIEVFDHVEGEAVFFWDCTPRQRRRMAEALHHDLDRLDAEDFYLRWAAIEPQQFG